MCGRIAIFSEPERLARVLDAGLAAELDGLRGPRWNVAPTTEVLGVADRRSEDGGDAGGLSRVLDRYRWGLVPPWAKDPAAGARMFNARAETVATKPSFRRAFASQRLLVPVDVTVPFRTRVATAPVTPTALPTVMVAPVRVRPPAPTVRVCVVAWPSPMLTVVELLTLSELVE